MENKLQSWWKKTVLTCEQVTLLSFNSSEQERLSFAENLKFRLHRALCVFCRRYYQQAKFLNKAMKKHQERSVEDNLPAKGLGDDAKDRLKKTLRDSIK